MAEPVMPRPARATSRPISWTYRSHYPVRVKCARRVYWAPTPEALDQLIGWLETGAWGLALSYKEIVGAAPPSPGGPQSL